MNVFDDLHDDEAGCADELMQGEVNACLVRGMYKIARAKEAVGDHASLSSARTIYAFIAGQYEKTPALKCSEIAFSAAALARLTEADNLHLEAEQLYIKTLCICIDYLGEFDNFTRQTFKNYACLLRAMSLPEEAAIVEMRSEAEPTALPAAETSESSPVGEGIVEATVMEATLIEVNLLEADAREIDLEDTFTVQLPLAS